MIAGFAVIAGDDVVASVQYATHRFYERNKIKADKVELPSDTDDETRTALERAGYVIASYNNNNMVIAGVEAEEWEKRHEQAES